MKLKFFTLLFIVTNLCFSQTENNLHNKIEKFKDTNLDSLLFYAKKGKYSNSVCEQLVGENAEAYYYYRFENYEKVISLIEKILTKYDSLSEKEQNDLCAIQIKVSTYNRLFWTYKNLEQYEAAYQQLIKSSDFISTLTNENFDSFNSLINIEISKALIKKELKLEDDAKQILKNLILKINLKQKTNKDSAQYNRLVKIKANTYNLLGKTYMGINKRTNKKDLLDSASLYFNKAYENAKSFIPPHPDSDLMYAFRRTEVLIAKKDFNRALSLINNYSKVNNGIDINQYKYLNKAICFHNLNKTDSAIYFSNKLLTDYSLKKSYLISVYDILSNQYLNTNQLDSAYKYSKLTLNEFNLARENKQKTYQLLYDNDIEKITHLNNTILKKEKKKNIKTIFFYTLTLLIISSLFLIKRKKYKKEISQKTDELKLNETIEEKEKTQKVNYNIEEALEKKIIEKIKAIDTNHDYLKHDFSINSIAENLQTNSTYISFVFNQQHEVTFKQYYTKKKIEYAVKLLNSSNIYRRFSIEGLAKEVGYTNASAFTRAFKKQMGVTPSAYIKDLS